VTLSVEIHGAVIQAAGVIDRMTVDLLLAAADFLFRRGYQNVTIDLAATTSLDAGAVSALCRVLDGQASGSHLHLLVPTHLRSRQLGFSRPANQNPLIAAIS